jgi:hypothetical protein
MPLDDLEHGCAARGIKIGFGEPLTQSGVINQASRNEGQRELMILFPAGEIFRDE